MVLYDDKKWLCKLIRTAFSIEDDTGICEIVLKQKPYLEGYDQSSDSSGSNESLDIREVQDVGHRRRSNTAMRLEELEQKKKSQTQTHIVRLNPGENLIKNEIKFERDTGYRDKKISEKPQFLTKTLLDAVPNPSKIPYVQYTKFDGSSMPDAPRKKIDIFISMLEASQRSYPLHIQILTSTGAKVSDLIGLILWNLKQNMTHLQLLSVHNYNLQISDELGEWDTDFPPLDPREPVSKFSFSHLALVPAQNLKKIEKTTEKSPLSLSFLLPNRTTVKLKLKQNNLTIGEIIGMVLKEGKWGGANFNNLGYHLEKLGESKIKYVDLGASISGIKTRDFVLVRDGAKSVQEDTELLTGSRNHVELVAGRSDIMICMIPVTVSTGRFNKLKNAMCLIWSGDRLDLEFQHKIKSYPLHLINSVKYDGLRKKNDEILICYIFLDQSLTNPPTTKLVQGD